MNQEVKIIHVLEKAVVLGVISIAWSFLCYLIALAYQQQQWGGLVVLPLGLASLLFVFVQSVLDITQMYTDEIYNKYGKIKSGLICIAIVYIALLPPAYTLLSLFKS